MPVGNFAERKFEILTLSLQNALNNEVLFHGLPGVPSKAPILAKELAFLIEEYAKHVAKYSVDDDAVRLGLRSRLEHKIWSSGFLSVTLSHTFQVMGLSHHSIRVMNGTSFVDKLVDDLWKGAKAHLYTPSTHPTEEIADEMVQIVRRKTLR